MLRKRSRNMKQKTTWFKKQVTTTYFAIFFGKRKTRENTKRNITLFGGPTNKKHFFF